MFAVQHAATQQQRFQKRAQRVGEDAGQRGLLAARMPLLRPGGGIVQLFPLEAGEIAAGQMKQIARQRDDLSAIAGQRFMDGLSLY